MFLENNIEEMNKLDGEKSGCGKSWRRVKGISSPKGISQISIAAQIFQHF